MNIILIQGRSDGCLLYYYEKRTNHNEVKTQFFNCTATYFMKKVCQNFETDFEGNRKAIKKNHHFIQKTPILVLFNHSLFFPTCSIESEKCSWINFYCVSEHFTCKHDQIHLEFQSHVFFRERLMNPYQTKSGEVDSSLNCDVWIECSQRVFKKQLQRCKEIDQYAREKFFYLNI